MQHKIKNDEAAANDKPVTDGPSLLDSSWHYVCVAYQGQQMGLLVETEDEEEAWQEAEDLCEAFGSGARTLSVTKVVIQ